MFGLPLSRAAADRPAADDEAAIRAAVESYVAAYNRADAKAVAEHWSENAEWISPSGDRIQGRQAIEEQMRAMFAGGQAPRIAVYDPKIRMVSDDVAVEEGVARVVRPGEPPEDSSYLAIHVKQDGKWKLHSVRETALPGPPVNENLKPLQWLVGEWIDSSGDSTVEKRVAFTKNGNFLTVQFKVSMPGMDDLEGTQVIGWDPIAGTIRSWVFDSDGGFGEGVWTAKNEQWLVRYSHVLADGRRATSTNVYTYVDGNSYRWRSIGRSVDGEFLPNVEDVTVRRKLAETAGEAAKAESSPAKKPDTVKAKEVRKSKSRPAKGVSAKRDRE